MQYKIFNSINLLIAVILFLSACNFTERLRTNKRYNLNKNIASQSIDIEKESTPLASIPSKTVKSNLNNFSSTDHIHINMELPPLNLKRVSVEQDMSNKQTEQVKISSEDKHYNSLNSNFEYSEIEGVKQNNQSTWEPVDNEVLLIVLSFFIPPLAVYLYFDTINDHFWIDLLLTFLFFGPGVIYALLVVTGTI